ncbi:MAG: AEC family transporter [Clostridiales bacterium]|jgi:predicted permease|nr:AEC family transporter [Clostridiales bacterium]
MNIMPVVQQIAMLLMLTLIGLYLRRSDVLNDGVVKGLNILALNFAWPAQVLTITQRDAGNLTPSYFLFLLGVSALVMSSITLICYFVPGARLPRERRTVFAGLCAMPNSGFVGVPLVQAAYGDEGVLYLSAFVVAFNLVWWTLYVRLFGGKISLRQLLLNNGLVASVAAVLMFILRIRVPEPFISLLSQLGALTTPVTMLLLGARLNDIKRIQDLSDKLLWVSVAIRLLAMPLAVAVALRLLGMTGMALSVLVLACALPCANSVQLFAERYNMDSVLASQAISVSLVLCLGTIPLVMLLTGI